MKTLSRLKKFAVLPPIIIPTQIIFHSAGDNYGVEGHLEWQLNGTLESHAYTSGIGDVYQIVPYNRRAQANYTANGPRRDGSGALSMESGSSINATEPWTELQIESLVEWSRERMAQFPTIAARRCPSADAPGLGYHIMFGTPGAWTPVAKACPGVERIKQFNQVLLPRITRAAGTVIDLGNKGETRPTNQADADVDEPEKLEEEDEEMLRTIQVVGQPTIYAYGPGTWLPLSDLEAYNVGVARKFWHEVEPCNEREKDVTKTLALQSAPGERVVVLAK